MILVDTNVGSEPLKPVPSPAVTAWLGRQDKINLHFSTVSQAEVLFGLECMPQGQRRRTLEDKFQQLMQGVFEDRILCFDSRAAKAFGQMMAHARRHGRQVATADGQIAAIAAVHGLTVATRDTAPFDAMGVPVTNPWQHA